MNILLAPSETKQQGGDDKPLDKTKLYGCQNIILEKYEKYISSSDIDQLSSWFGLKNLEEVKRYKQSVMKLPTMKAIQRYTGVAFEAIAYNTLKQDAKKFIDNHIFIYSNLLGVVKANMFIPDYKFKQGAILPNIDNEKFYQNNLKDILDTILEDEVLDLSATYYTKYYKPSGNVIRYKFLKDGKVVSHWAKYYRGLMVKQIAQNNIKNFEELMSFKFDNLTLKEIQERKNIRTIVMDIKDEMVI